LEAFGFSGARSKPGITFSSATEDKVLAAAMVAPTDWRNVLRESGPERAEL